MSDLSDAFLARARESLLGAESEYVNRRYNNVANRAYYACFQAAIAALDLGDIRPPGNRDEWDHGFVQSQFGGVLVYRRKRYPPELRSTLTTVRAVRDQGDYRQTPVTRKQATHALARTRLLVTAVQRSGDRPR